MTQVQRTIPIVVPDDPDVLATVRLFLFTQQVVSLSAFGWMKRLERVEQARRLVRPPSALALHHECYDAVKGKVSSQMTATAIRLVAGALQSAWRKGHPLHRPFVFRRPLAVWLIGRRGRDASLVNSVLRIAKSSGEKFPLHRSLCLSVSLSALVSLLGCLRLLGGL